MATLLVVCALSVITDAVAGAFIHPYMMEVYSRSTNTDGSFHPDVRMEDLNVWGFTDEGECCLFCFTLRVS